MNKPGEEIEKLVGGVAGGSIVKGVLKVGQSIEIRPGFVTRGGEGGNQRVCKPIKSIIKNLRSEENFLNYAVPGGLIAVGTQIDPTMTRADHLVGNVSF